MELYRMTNDELSYFVFMNETEKQTCDTCKYADDCPAEYKQEQPNYCENWEKISHSSPNGVENNQHNQRANTSPHKTHIVVNFSEQF